MRFVVALICLLWSLVVQAGEILAVVNDYPISDFDVRVRAEMIALQQGPDAQPKEQLKKLAFDDLIDEQIKAQEIAKRKITVADEEVYNAIAQMEQQNGLPVGGLKQIFRERGIPYTDLLRQVKVNFGWMKLLQSSNKAVAVQPREIETRKNLIRKDLQKTLLSFYEIVVKNKNEAAAVLNKLKSGEKFEALAAQYSVAKTRAVGGRVIGADSSYYGERAASALESLDVGDISDPFPVPDGYAIVLMVNKRAPIMSDRIAVWDLAQAVLPENSVASLSLNSAEDCESFIKITQKEALAGSQERGMVNPGQLPKDIFALLENQSVKTVVGPEKIPAGNLYFMKCQVSEQRIVPSDEELKMRIGMEKMELLSRQILSELKRDVVIDYK